MENITGIDKVVLSILSKAHGLVGEAVAFEDEIAVCSLHGIVEYNYRIGAEIRLVGELAVEQVGSGVGAEVHGLVPADAVVVYVDLA